MSKPSPSTLPHNRPARLVSLSSSAPSLPCAAPCRRSTPRSRHSSPTTPSRTLPPRRHGQQKTLSTSRATTRSSRASSSSRSPSAVRSLSASRGRIRRRTARRPRLPSAGTSSSSGATRRTSCCARAEEPATRRRTRCRGGRGVSKGVRRLPRQRPETTLPRRLLVKRHEHWFRQSCGGRCRSQCRRLRARRQLRSRQHRSCKPPTRQQQ